MKILIFVTINVFATVAFGQEKIQPAPTPTGANQSQSVHGLVAPASAELLEPSVAPIAAPRRDGGAASASSASGPRAHPGTVEGPAALPTTSRNRVTAADAQPVKQLALPAGNKGLSPVTTVASGSVSASAATPRLAPQ